MSTNKLIQETEVSMQMISNKQAVEMAKDRVANTIYEGVIRLGLSSGQICVFISTMDGINSYEKDHGKPNKL